MADEDTNFDIDIYGDDTNPDEFPGEQMQDADGGEENYAEHANDQVPHDNANDPNDTNDANGNGGTNYSRDDASSATLGHTPHTPQTQQIASTGGPASNQMQPPKQAPVQQGVKRKAGDEDDRPVDPSATSALMISDLHWWSNEDDIRGWVNQCGCEDELKDVTFNEHKVNGKSKGQAYVELSTAQAATSLKHKIDSFSADSPSAVKKHTVTYHHGSSNPFKTLPKDVPGGRHQHNRNDHQRGGSNFNQNSNFSTRGYNRGGYNNRGGGGMNNNFNNRNFSGPPMMGGMQGAGGYGGGMGGFNNNMGGQFGGFNNRGGMGGMNNMRGNMGGRGGRGGMNAMGGMGMGGMGMGMPMGGGVPMGNMGMGMGGMQGGGYGAQGHFNPAFFGGAGGAGQGGWDGGNPNKRARQE